MENQEKESSEISKTVEYRKTKIKESIFRWLKNPYNLAFVIIFIGIIILRLYYFWMTKNQPVWWDESEYLAKAKDFAGMGKYQLAEQRLPGFPLLMAPFFIMGITSEPVLRFFFAFLPSILAIFLLYFCVKEMYPNKKIALISLAIFGVLWEHIFYSNRFHTENPALIFEFLALIIFFKVYMRKENLYFIKPRYSLIWVGLFCVLSVLLRPGNLLFVPSVFIFFFILNQNYFLKKSTRKYTIIGLIIILITAIIFIYYLKQIPLLRGYYSPQVKISWVILTSFWVFYQSVISWMPPIFFYAFLLGITISLINILIILDKFRDIQRDSKNLEFKSDIYNIILIPTMLAVFIFIMRVSGFEPRWIFPCLPAMLPFTSKGIIYFSEFVTKFFLNKNFNVFLIILLCSMGMYNQLVHADTIIKIKLDSFIQLKEAGLFIRENSEPDDVVFSRSLPQASYYTERQSYSYNAMFNESAFIDFAIEKHPKYALEFIFEPGLPTYIVNPSQDFQKILKPIRAWFLDNEKKQVASIVYEIDYNAIPEAYNNLKNLENQKSSSNQKTNMSLPENKTSAQETISTLANKS